MSESSDFGGGWGFMNLLKILSLSAIELFGPSVYSNKRWAKSTGVSWVTESIGVPVVPFQNDNRWGASLKWMLLSNYQYARHMARISRICISNSPHHLLIAPSSSLLLHPLCFFLILPPRLVSFLLSFFSLICVLLPPSSILHPSYSLLIPFTLKPVQPDSQLN